MSTIIKTLNEFQNFIDTHSPEEYGIVYLCKNGKQSYHITQPQKPIIRVSLTAINAYQRRYQRHVHEYFEDFWYDDIDYGWTCNSVVELDGTIRREIWRVS